MTIQRLALLAGVETYEAGSGISPLQYALRDAEEVGRVLEERCGFTSRVLPNPTDSALLAGLVDMAARLGPEDIFVFLFAGHGAEMMVGDVRRSFLYAGNANLDFHTGLVDCMLLQKVLAKIPCRQRLLFFDCCRNDPERGKGEADNVMGETLSRDLEFASQREGNTPRVTMLLKACRVQERAYEWDEERHGVFSYYLKRGLLEEAWEGGVLEGRRLCRYVQQGVAQWAKKKGKRQTPDFQQLESAEEIILFGDRSRMVAQPAAHLVVCPLCGKKNGEADTFACRACIKDNLCLRHQDTVSFLCQECEEQRLREKRREAFCQEQLARKAGTKSEREQRLHFVEQDRLRVDQKGSSEQECVAGGPAREFIWMPGGNHDMATKEEHASSDEQSVHQVTLSGFCLGKYPVPQGAVEKVKENNLGGFEFGTRHLLENVSWGTTQALFDTLNQQVGRQYRFPMGVEWKYVAHCGEEDERLAGSSGEGRLGESVWYGEHSGGCTNSGWLKKSNDMVFHGMSCNAWALQGDWWYWGGDILFYPRLTLTAFDQPPSVTVTAPAGATTRGVRGR